MSPVPSPQRTAGGGGDRTALGAGHDARRGGNRVLRPAVAGRRPPARDDPDDPVAAPLRTIRRHRRPRSARCCRRRPALSSRRPGHLLRRGNGRPRVPRRRHRAPVPLPCHRRGAGGQGQPAASLARRGSRCSALLDGRLGPGRRRHGQDRRRGRMASSAQAEVGVGKPPHLSGSGPRPRPKARSTALATAGASWSSRTTWPAEPTRMAPTPTTSRSRASSAGE